MSFSDNPKWSNLKIKAEKDAASDNGKQKYLQKFCDKWLALFEPWLARCDDDPNKPFCKACQCRLDCNRCHLQRHSRTTKHGRNLQILISKGEGAARENLSIRQERSKYYQQRLSLVQSPSENFQEDSMNTSAEIYEEGDEETSFKYEPTHAPEENDEEMVMQELPRKHVVLQPQAQQKHGGSLVRTKIEHRLVAPHKERMKLLMQIKKDKHDLMDSFKELLQTPKLGSSTPKERNHVDLFFDSISSTVKLFSPKLIAEAKARVSQLVCELELRSVTEEEAAAHRNTAGGVSHEEAKYQHQSHDEDSQPYV